MLHRCGVIPGEEYTADFIACILSCRQRQFAHIRRDLCCLCEFLVMHIQNTDTMKLSGNLTGRNLSSATFCTLCTSNLACLHNCLSLDRAKRPDAPNSQNYLHLHMLRHLVAAASWLNNEAHV